MSKLLVEVMGGTIGAASTVGVGSDFWFDLNATSAPQPVPAVATPVSAPSTPEPAAGPPRTLLYVEDNAANLMLVQQLIGRRPDLRLLTAGDGRRGILLAREHQPAAILMDINLPGMSGIEAMRLLHADPLTAHIPVLAISANAMQADIDRGLSAGFVRYLTKPINVAAFLGAIDALLAPDDSKRSP